MWKMGRKRSTGKSHNENAKTYKTTDRKSGQHLILCSQTLQVSSLEVKIMMW